MFRIPCLIIGYFLGSISFAYIIGRSQHTDLRKKGSGNLGTTNTIRVLGKKFGAINFILDLAKSIAAFYICYNLFKADPLTAAFYGSTGAILGHDFPFYLKFKGGKGVASAIGMMIANWNLATIITIVIGVCFGLSGYISLGSMVFVVTIPIVLAIMHYSLEIVLITVGIAILTLVKHKENIIRLKNGNENKLFNKKKHTS